MSLVSKARTARNPCDHSAMHSALSFQWLEAPAIFHPWSHMDAIGIMRSSIPRWPQEANVCVACEGKWRGGGERGRVARHDQPLHGVRGQLAGEPEVKGGDPAALQGDDGAWDFV